MAAPPRDVDLPTALRLDFAAGPVWFVAGTPRFPEADALIPGDDIIVVFTAAKMRDLGYPDPLR
ncbi:hypothetical protein O7634_14425 [Micromonospora sp. WMMD1120]|uniref:hypothetical protein n=1 Tax=Micromonospora sp. WMMD1120 TaxID=3016106 RepID=UPI002416A128|nr:hypothetical protein [Micromonospora sp. WMMD1120]MDG4807948.1 hypothetical protein [Micromonospora sp. WMMD1120]